MIRYYSIDKVHSDTFVLLVLLLKALSFSLATIFLMLAFLTLGSFCGKRPDANQDDIVPNVQPELSEVAQKGQQLFQESGCQACHGPEGKGDGPAGKNLNPPPRDYSHKMAYKQGYSVEDITNTLLTGVPGTTMAPYPHISEADRRAIATYVVYLQNLPPKNKVK